MRVILLEDVRGIGNKYEVKEVKGGYARNFLIPRNLAKLATPEALKKLAVQKANWEAAEREIRKNIEAIAKNLEGRSLTFFLKVDEKGHPYSSINKDMILSAIRDNHLVTKERVNIKLDHPLKELGTHEIEVDFKKGIKTKFKIELRSQP